MAIRLRCGLFLLTFLLSTLPTFVKAHLRCVGCSSKCCCRGKCCRCSHLIYEMWWFWLLWCLVVLLSCCCAYLKRRHRRLANNNRNISNHGNNQRRFGNNNQELNTALPIEKLPSYTDAIKSPNRDLPAPPPPAYVDMTGATGDNCFPSGMEHFTEIPLDTNQNSNTDGDKINNVHTDNDKTNSPEYNQVTSSPNQPSSPKVYTEASL